MAIAESRRMLRLFVFWWLLLSGCGADPLSVEAVPYEPEPELPTKVVHRAETEVLVQRDPVPMSRIAAPLHIHVEGEWPRVVSAPFDQLGAGVDEVRFVVDAEVQAHFDYSVDGQPVVGNGAVEQVRGRFTIPIGTQTLGPALQVAEPGSVHRIAVEVTTLDGSRTATAAVEFTLELISPPAYLSNCRLSDDLLTYRLDDATLHELFDGRTAHVMTAELTYGASGGPMVTVEAEADVDLRITEVAETKFQEADFSDLIISSLSELPACPFAQAGGGVAITYGVHERTQAWDGAWHCDLGGYYAPQGTVVADLVNDPLVTPSRVVQTTAGRTVTLELLVDAPEVYFATAPFDWSTDPNVSSVLMPVDPGVARYYVPLSLGLHHSGVDRYLVSPTSPVQERVFETRGYVQQAEIEVAPLSLQVRHPTVPYLEVEVIRDASCADVLTYVTAR